MAVPVDDGNKTRALVLALLALACGHMLSTLLRTIPAISLDVMAADFATPPQTLAEPDLDLSFLVCRVADSGRRARWIVSASGRFP